MVDRERERGGEGREWDREGENDAYTNFRFIFRL